MGGKKSKKKPFVARTPIRPMDKWFDCPFCNHEKSCKANLEDKKRKHWATIACIECGESFGMKTNELTEGVDVYAEWIDACEEANA